MEQDNVIANWIDSGLRENYTLVELGDMFEDARNRVKNAEKISKMQSKIDNNTNPK